MPLEIRDQGLAIRIRDLAHVVKPNSKSSASSYSLEII